MEVELENLGLPMMNIRFDTSSNYNNSFLLLPPMKPIISLLLLISSILFACRTSKKNHQKYREVDTVSISAYNNPMNIYRAATPQLWNIVHTRVALSFDYAAKTASGQEWVTLQPYFYPTDTLCLDAKGMKIETVTIGHEDKPLKYTYDSSQIHIQLDKKYTQYEQVKLAIKYVAMPYAQTTGGSTAITDDRGLYFINTDNKIAGKPVQIWTQGETESNSHWLPTLDKPNMRTTVQMELTVPAQYKTLSNGELISSMDRGSLRTDIWKMEQPIQVYAIMFAIGDFYIAKDKWRGKEVNYYVEPSYAPYAHKMFQYTPEMIEYFSNITGVPYPWNKYSQVVVRDYVSGAMENTSASLFGEFMNQDHREYADKNHEDVVSHELFHQWFGDYVTAESWSHLTVNESFATYGEYLWRKHKYGLAYADELAWSDLQRYLANTDYSDPVLVRYHYRDKEEMFDGVSYQKGGATLHYLHQLIGDTAFYRAMKLYLTKNALQSAEATHWRLAVEEATGKDWNWFFNEWYHRAGHPILDIQYNYDDAAKKLIVTLTQKQDGKIGLYHLPLKTMLIYGSEKTIVDWEINKKTQSLSYDYKNGIAPVIVPDVVHALPGVIKENKTYKEWLVQMNTCDDFVSQLLALSSVQAKDYTKEQAQAILDKGLNSKNAAIREVALSKMLYIGNEKLQNKWKPDVVMMATNDGNHVVRARAIEVLGNWKLKEQKEMLLEAVNDSSYMVAGYALSALYRIDSIIGYQLAKKKLNHKPNTVLDSKAWAIVADHASDEDTTLFKTYSKQKPNERKHLLLDLAAFAIKTNHEKSFVIANQLLGDMIVQQENKSQRAYYAALFENEQDAIAELLKQDKKNGLNMFKLDYIKKMVAQLKANEPEKEVQRVYEQILK